MRKENDPGPEPEATSTTSTPATATAAKGYSHVNAAESVPAQLERRRHASFRLPPLQSGHRDPIRKIAEQPWTDNQRCAWVDAVSHLRGVGLRPVVDDTVLRSLFVNGHRELALGLRDGDK